YPVKLAGRDQATGSDHQSESCSLERQKAIENIRKPKIPGFSERKRAASQRARWEARWASLLCS
ncbi:hypothetical protein A2U01_0109377, partial [Trifolium medium]|nr:hypothetical protein [Trifolium medium]